MIPYIRKEKTIERRIYEEVVDCTAEISSGIIMDLLNQHFILPQGAKLNVSCVYLTWTVPKDDPSLKQGPIVKRPDEETVWKGFNKEDE